MLMKYGKYVIIFVLCAGCFGAGIFIERCTSVPVETVHIVEKLKTITKYVKNPVPSTCKGYEECFFNPITIDGKIIDQVYFLVTAADTCKSSERKFKMGGIGKTNLNLITVNYIHIFNVGSGLMDIGGNLSYYRIFVNTSTFQFGIGGGVIVTNHSAGLQLGTIFQF